MEFYFEKLKVWQESMNLVKEVYLITEKFPIKEQYGLTMQLRRCVISIPSNIAEGQGRYHRKEFIQFLYNARGSLYEIITQLKLGQDLGYLTNEYLIKLRQQCHSIESKLSGLINSMKNRI